METMSGPSPYSIVHSQCDAELFSLSFDQLLGRYVDEIFSDYLDRRATVPEVLDEIKGIIAVLIAARTWSEGKQVCQAGGLTEQVRGLCKWGQRR
jgi:hypothetical protein